MIWAQIVISKRYRKHMRRFGPEPDHHKLKDAVSFIGQLAISSNTRALSTLKTFILKTVGGMVLIEKVQIFRKTITYIQNKFRNQMATRYAKVEVLMNYWDKLYG
jgi:hypothetical protein